MLNKYLFSLLLIVIATLSCKNPQSKKEESADSGSDMSKAKQIFYNYEKPPSADSYKPDEAVVFEL